MLHRFLAGSAIASIAVAVGATALLLMSPATLSRFYPVTHLWCLAPVAWGVWAMVTPPTWTPHRFPVWGAILGFVLGMNAAFVLNVPSRILGETVPVWARTFGVVVAVVAYYLMWMAVRAVYVKLTTSSTAPATKEGGKKAAAA